MIVEKLGLIFNMINRFYNLYPSFAILIHTLLKNVHKKFLIFFPVRENYF